MPKPRTMKRNPLMLAIGLMAFSQTFAQKADSSEFYFQKGIEYYKELSSDFSKICDKFKTSFINELELLENELNNIEILEA